MTDLGYRPCVGVMLINAQGRAFVGKRMDSSRTMGREGNWWQMPQGGIDRGEAPDIAAYRELEEETGVTALHAQIIGRAAEPIRYDLPDHLIGKIWGGKYRGQEQEWFLMRFSGSDEHINLSAHDPAEFCEWRWVEPETLPDLIVPFKQHVYNAVLKSFRHLI